MIAYKVKKRFLLESLEKRKLSVSQLSKKTGYPTRWIYYILTLNRVEAITVVARIKDICRVLGIVETDVLEEEDGAGGGAR